MNGHPIPGALSRLERQQWHRRSMSTARLCRPVRAPKMPALPARCVARNRVVVWASPAQVIVIPIRWGRETRSRKPTPRPRWIRRGPDTAILRRISGLLEDAEHWATDWHIQAAEDAQELARLLTRDLRSDGKRRVALERIKLAGVQIAMCERAARSGIKPIVEPWGPFGTVGLAG